MDFPRPGACKRFCLGCFPLVTPFFLNVGGIHADLVALQGWAQLPDINASTNYTAAAQAFAVSSTGVIIFAAEARFDDSSSGKDPPRVRNYTF